jgi:hypothetical protein
LVWPGVSLVTIGHRHGVAAAVSMVLFPLPRLSQEAWNHHGLRFSNILRTERIVPAKDLLSFPHWSSPIACTRTTSLFCTEL